MKKQGSPPFTDKAKQEMAELINLCTDTVATCKEGPCLAMHYKMTNLTPLSPKRFQELARQVIAERPPMLTRKTLVQTATA
ncbi:MAG TPA: hypothetical protein VHP58_06995 [Alphaproteobacteria bacterium]|nr:hypothetical protein [Alphaproteobacteria bacterium]